jgi:GDP-4-dehydro-6-deoxy-D-mannose reductase
MRPLSPYGVSKVAAELSGLQYHHNYGLHVVVTRSFNHVGPYQGDRCAIQTFTQQMAAIEAGKQPPHIAVGNLDPRRDFTHTSDVARALWLLLEHSPPGAVYNLCSGTATRIGDILALTIQHGKVPVEVRADPTRLRPADEPLLVGDNSRLREVTGWKPTVSMDDIVQELLTYWRQRIT